MESSPPPNRYYHHVVVIVLGDVGRSPRMQYHTLSLLENGFHVSLVGYSGEVLIPQLNTFQQYHSTNNNRLHVFRFQPYNFPSFLRRGIFKPIYYILRALSLLWILFYTLFFQVSQSQHIPPVQCVLVQNPPSIPTLIIAFLFCKIQHYRTGKFVKFIIDWHNLGFTMFDVSPTHPIRRWTEKYEIYMAQKANLHFCVTHGMKQWLLDHTNVDTKHILVLYDRPPDFFQSTSNVDKHVLWKKMNTQFWDSCSHLMTMYHIPPENKDATLLTIQNHSDDGSILLQKTRPAVLVSSTSWTPDEDFGILLHALLLLDTHIDQNQPQSLSIFQHVLVIVTGKGPLKAMYLEKIQRLALKYVTIQTMWLEAVDYPRLLGCADLGISLHTSTSGIDLPMKVVDMFGCQVPVCAMGFPCITELVTDTVHGRIFTTSEELCNQLYELIFTAQGKDLLKGYRLNIQNLERWRENWNETAGATILDLCRDDKVKIKVG